MRYCAYHPIDVVNGHGTRCTLFVAGCEHQCPGCYNKSTWSFARGLEFDQAMEDQVLKDLGSVTVPRRGISLTGGDPLHPRNLPAILKLVQRIRLELPKKDIWCWTGYSFETLTEEQLQVVKLLDCLIDGKFVKALADPSLPWRGSSNQNVINLKEKLLC